MQSEDGETSIALPAPLLNIEIAGTHANGTPKAYVCNWQWPENEVLIYTSEADQNQEGSAGICLAGAYYQWGFSFLLTFIVSILNLLCVSMLYGLWIDARRDGDIKRVKEAVPSEREPSCASTYRSVNSPGHLRNALIIAHQAERQYGADVHEWQSWRLRRIWNGEGELRFGDVKCSSLAS